MVAMFARGVSSSPAAGVLAGAGAGKQSTIEMTLRRLTTALH